MENKQLLREKSVKKVLVLGITGMLGSRVFQILSKDDRYVAYGTMRHPDSLRFFPDKWKKNIIIGINILDQDSLVDVFNRVRPDVVINCIGLIKQIANSNDPLVALPINSMLPHRLAGLCQVSGARTIHISTDCVYSGEKGAYVEADISDAKDLYGKSKYIGELHNGKNTITIRTSIIGHELETSRSLIDWFLTQTGPVRGFGKAIFSGLPTIELARVIADYVIPNKKLKGLFHVSGEPIDKYSLLGLVAQAYGKKISIEYDDSVIIDRSLNSSRFHEASGYSSPNWTSLVERMQNSQELN
jgi:dTDP-4-dehydrorhamnose reductase